MYQPTDSLKDYFIFDNHVWCVMKFESGYSQMIMTRLFEQTFAMLDRYSKVLFTRFDLHICDYSPNNKAISRLMRLVKKELKNQYCCEVAYLWVREQANTEKQHYHGLLMLNAHKVRHPANIYKIVKRFCNEISVFSLYIPKHSYYLVSRGDNESIQAPLYRASYLAKNHSKGNRPLQTKDFQATRLKRIG